MDIMQSEFVHILPDHETELRNKLYQQWQEGKLCDLTISLNGGELQAHSCVLAAFSPKLKIILETLSLPSESGNERFIHLTFQEKVFQCLLNMMYTGVLSFNITLLSSVLSTARWMQMDEVVRLCQEYKEIMGNTSDESELTDEAVLIEVSRKPGICDKEPETTVLSKTSIKRGRKRGGPSEVVSASPKAPQQKTRKGNILNQVIVKVEAETEIYETDPGKEMTDNFSSALKEITFPDPVDPNPSEIPKETSVPKKTRCKLKPKKSEMVKSKQKPAKQKKTKAATSVITEVKTENPSPSPDESTDPSISNPTLLSHIQWVEAQSTDRHAKEEADFALGKTDHIRCKRCLSRFTQLEKYLCHVTNHPSYKCDHCSATYYRQSNLTRHMRTNHSSEHHLRCQKCDFVVGTEKKLRDHFRDVHGGDKPFICHHPGCTYSSWKFDFLRRHSEIHSEVKQYVCNKCGEGFSQHAGLMSHERTCYHLQQFLCDVCGQAFNHVQSMRAHRRTIHLGEKPYLCKVCGNQFSDQRNLKRHMRIHENSFPYQCPVCQQNYRHSNSLKAHVKKHEKFSLNLNVSRIIKDAQRQKKAVQSEAKKDTLGESTVQCDNLSVTSELGGYFTGSGQSAYSVAGAVFPGQLISTTPSQPSDGSSDAISGPSKTKGRPSLCTTDSAVVKRGKVSQGDCDAPKQSNATENKMNSDLFTAVPFVVSDQNLDLDVTDITGSVVPTSTNFSQSSADNFLASSALDSSLPKLQPLITAAGAATTLFKVELLSASSSEETQTIAEMDCSEKVLGKDSKTGQPDTDTKLKGQSSYGLQTLAEICFSSSV